VFCIILVTFCSTAFIVVGVTALPLGASLWINKELFALGDIWGCDGASQNPHMRILCAKSVGCGCRFVARSKL